MKQNKKKYLHKLHVWNIPYIIIFCHFSVEKYAYCHFGMYSTVNPPPKFELCWNYSDVTVYTCTELRKLKYKLILSIKTIGWYGATCVEVLCVFEGKIGLVCWHLLYNVHAIDILWFNLAVNSIWFLPEYMKLWGFFERIRQ